MSTNKVLRFCVDILVDGLTERSLVVFFFHNGIDPILSVPPW